jgi:hypothetical protein
MLPHVWQLIAKYVDNNRRKISIIVRNMHVASCEKFMSPFTLSKDVLKEKGTP